VFKVFVANPRKPPAIVAALVRNQARLVGYLEQFHADRNDPQFLDEKALIVDTLRKLAPPAPAAAPAAVAVPQVE
jgi:calcium binding protein 39